MAEVVAKGYAKWENTISTYEVAFKKWTQRVDRILKRYRDDSTMGRTSGARFNILWSNVQTIVPAVFARLPKPDVSRRFRDNDPVGRVASLILERGLEFEIEHYPDYRAAMLNCVQDRFLGGRGTAWVRFEPHFGSPDDGVQITEDADEADADEETGESIEYECAPVDYVNWKDFGHNVSRTWEEVTSVWRKVYMGRGALVERFGEKLGKSIPLDTRPEDQKKTAGGDADYQALIYEIWDKESGRALWLSKSLGKIIDERPDPLGLENFWPCARPLYSTLTSDSLEPVPDFTLYQDQARELDTLADRIDGLIDALKVRGVYDASVDALSRLFTEGENNGLIPVSNWAAFAEKQGLKGAIDLVDIKPIAEALMIAYEAVERVKNVIYEIIGLADIMRGASDPNETLGAQQLKAQFGGMRLKSMQGQVVGFATELLQIKAQIMCKHFQPETLAKIAAVQQFNAADQQFIQPALELLANESLSDFRISISSDSMVQMDENQDKQDKMEFLKAVGMFMEQMSQVAQTAPEAMPLAVEMLKFGVTAFKAGKTLEGVIDQAADQLREAAQQPKQPKPDPEMEKIKAQVEMHKVEQANTAQIDQQRNQMEAQREAAKLQQEGQLQQAKIAAEERIAGRKLDLEKYKIDAETSRAITVAQISAQSAMDTGLIGAESAANSEVTEKLGEGQTAAPPKPSPMDKLHNMHSATLNHQAVMQQQSQAQTQAMHEQAQAMHQANMQGHQGTQQAIQALVAAQKAPKSLVRQPDGTKTLITH